MKTYQRPPPSLPSAVLGLHHPSPHYRDMLLFIFRLAEGRRLSWSEHIVVQQLAEGCLLRQHETVDIYGLEVRLSPYSTELTAV